MSGINKKYAIRIKKLSFNKKFKTAYTACIRASDKLVLIKR